MCVCACACSGDLWSYNCEYGKYVVSPVPDVTVHKLDRSRQRFLIIASDGVWNMMSAEDAVNCVWSSVNSQVRQVLVIRHTNLVRHSAIKIIVVS
jgi:serine/threonine protein phosphatase PrpC